MFQQFKHILSSLFNKTKQVQKYYTINKDGITTFCRDTEKCIAAELGVKCHVMPLQAKLVNIPTMTNNNEVAVHLTYIITGKLLTTTLNNFVCLTGGQYITEIDRKEQ